MPRVTELHINGATHPVDADAESSLLSVLRDQLDLTGSKYGCGEGQCGACTVLLDGASRRSCRTPVGAAASQQITTIESLAREGTLHPVQQAFLETEVETHWKNAYPGMVKRLERDLPELLSFFSFPRQLWRSLRTTNVNERCFVEVRRRTRPMVCFVNVASVERILFSIFNRFNEDWRNRILQVFTQAA